MNGRRRPRRGRHAARLPWALLTLAALGPARARAADAAPTPPSFSIDRFDPAPPGDRFESVRGASVAGEELFRVGLTFDYARAPLVARAAPAPLVDHQLVLHANLSLALWERLLVTFALPVVLVNDGPRAVASALGAEARQSAPNAASVGSVALGARLFVVGAPRNVVDLAVGGAFWLPTGRPSELTGDVGVRAMPYASMSGAHGRLVYASSVGVLVQRSQDYVDVHLGPELRTAIAAAFVTRDDRLQLGAELNGAAPLGKGDGGASALFAAELLGTGRARFGDVVLGAGLGPGLARGVGTPRFRAVVTVAFTPTGEVDSDHDGVIDLFDACPTVKGAADEDPEQHGCPPDRDGDGVVDALDACPDEPGVRGGDGSERGCPVPTDRDGDGIPDERDACPDDRGAPRVDPKKNGCPPDRDGDGVLDAVDACPDQAGVDDPDPARRGCPVDSDGDGVVDAVDACPTVPGVPSAVASQNGCPRGGVGPKRP